MFQLYLCKVSVLLVAAAPLIVADGLESYSDY